jgi:hypothetical protein
MTGWLDRSARRREGEVTLKPAFLRRKSFLVRRRR